MTLFRNKINCSVEKRNCIGRCRALFIFFSTLFASSVSGQLAELTIDADQSLIASYCAQQSENSTDQGDERLVGWIILTSESVSARLPGQLLRRSEVFERDKITTSTDSYTQIFMIDSAIIALGSNSELLIHYYKFRESAEDCASLELLSGTLRMITGDIAESSESNLELITPAALIKPRDRGGDFEVTISDSTQSVYVGIYDGGFTLGNSVGLLKLGIGGDADFASVDIGNAPEGISNQPPQLDTVMLLKPFDWGSAVQ